MLSSECLDKGTRKETEQALATSLSVHYKSNRFVLVSCYSKLSATMHHTRDSVLALMLRAQGNSWPGPLLLVQWRGARRQGLGRSTALDGGSSALDSPGFADSDSVLEPRVTSARVCGAREPGVPASGGREGRASSRSDGGRAAHAWSSGPAGRPGHGWRVRGRPGEGGSAGRPALRRPGGGDR